MRIDALKKYALANSTANSRSYSLSFDPILLQNSNDYATFSCEGSSGSAYTISVYYDTKFVSSNCSCPYSYEVICKHSIAAIRVLTNLLENEGSVKLDFGERQTGVLKPNEILLDQGMLKKSTIDQLGQFTITNKLI